MTIHNIAEEKKICRYCLQTFRITEKLKCDIKDCLKINGKQTIKMSKKGESTKFWKKNKITIHDLRRC